MKKQENSFHFWKCKLLYCFDVIRKQHKTRFLTLSNMIVAEMDGALKSIIIKNVVLMVETA